MKMGHRLLGVAAILAGAGAAAALVLVALKENINLFYTPTEVAHDEAPLGHTFRVGGLVAPGSVEREPGSLRVSFRVGDGANEITVEYTGILPDLFREGQGIVAQGRLEADGRFRAEQVLAKHDENYMPPEVRDAIDKAALKPAVAEPAPR